MNTNFLIHPGKVHFRSEIDDKVHCQSCHYRMSGELSEDCIVQYIVQCIVQCIVYCIVQYIVQTCHYTMSPEFYRFTLVMISASLLQIQIQKLLFMKYLFWLQLELLTNYLKNSPSLQMSPLYHQSQINALFIY